MSFTDSYDAYLFQSTLSMRRATRELHRLLRRLSISIHALHEESDPECANGHRSDIISIHALHEESDEIVTAVGKHDDISIHALHEESDCHVQRRSGDHGISIHALHEESDLTSTGGQYSCGNFNPRSP